MLYVAAYVALACLAAPVIDALLARSGA